MLTLWHEKPTAAQKRVFRWAFSHLGTARQPWQGRTVLCESRYGRGAGPV